MYFLPFIFLQKCLEKTKVFLQDCGNNEFYHDLVNYLESKYNENDFPQVQTSSSLLLSPPSNSNLELDNYEEDRELGSRIANNRRISHSPILVEPINLAFFGEESRNHSFVWRPWWYPRVWPFFFPQFKCIQYDNVTLESNYKHICTHLQSLYESSIVTWYTRASSFSIANL